MPKRGTVGCPTHEANELGGCPFPIIAALSTLASPGRASAHRTARRSRRQHSDLVLPLPAGSTSTALKCTSPTRRVARRRMMCLLHASCGRRLRHPDPGSALRGHRRSAGRRRCRPVVTPAVCTEHQRVFTREIDSTADSNAAHGAGRSKTWPRRFPRGADPAAWARAPRAEPTDL